MSTNIWNYYCTHIEIVCYFRIRYIYVKYEFMCRTAAKIRRVVRKGTRRNNETFWILWSTVVRDNHNIIFWHILSMKYSVDNMNRRGYSVFYRFRKNESILFDQWNSKFKSLSYFFFFTVSIIIPNHNL